MRVAPIGGGPRVTYHAVRSEKSSLVTYPFSRLAADRHVEGARFFTLIWVKPYWALQLIVVPEYVS